MQVNRKAIIMIVIDMLILTLALAVPNVWKISAILVVWINMIIYTISDLKNHVALFAFLISFFTFLIGRQALERFGFHTIESVFSEEINSHAEILLLISLMVIFGSYIFSHSIRVTKNRGEYKIDYNSIKYESVRYTSKIIYYATYFFNLYSVLEIVSYVLQHGYAAFYTGYTTKVPYLIGKIGDMSPIAFWVYLSTMPSKKESKIPITFYIIYLCISLGTGKRFKFVAGLLTLFVYYVMRNKINSNGEVWFGKKLAMLCVAGVPVLLILLVAVSKIRFGTKLTTEELLNSMTSFFYSQGVSINVIKRTQLYAGRLPKGKIYMLGSVIDFLQSNIISRMMGIKHFSGNTVEHALYGNSLEHTLSYVAMGNYYLKGRGLGGCYIAEAFHDLEYAGVVIVNIIYGIVLNKMFRFESRGIWTSALTFLILNSLLLAPRGSADGFFADMVDLSTWGTFIIIYICSNLLIKKTKNIKGTMV